MVFRNKIQVCIKKIISINKTKIKAKSSSYYGRMENKNKPKKKKSLPENVVAENNHLTWSWNSNRLEARWLFSAL